MNPEKRVKTDFETVFFESENADQKSGDQKCIFALCENPTLSKKGEPWRDLYIAFRGTDVNDYEDILTGQFCVHTYSNLPNNQVGPFNRVDGRFLRN